MKEQRKGFTPLLETAYQLYFDKELPNREFPWVPTYSCCSCYRTLLGWMKGTHKGLPFAKPMVWTNPTNHMSDCYFCLTKIHGFSKALKHKIEYPSRPTLHSEAMPVPISPNIAGRADELDSEPGESEKSFQDDPDFLPSESEEPHVITQEELNDLIQDLELPNTKAQLLASRLKQ